jgi:hypothetical protein
MPLQQGADRGQAAQWEVGAWTEGGNLPDAKIALTSTAGAGVPTFTFGCASGIGTSACDLGAVDSTSAQRLFQAQITVPLTATITAVSLTATGSAAGLATAPSASGSMIVLAPGTPTGSTSPLSVSSGLAFPSPSMSPGGNAASLFPTLAPGATERASPVANVSALGSGTPVGTEVAEGAGLAALGVAMLLAITRVSLRRPAPRHAASSTVAAAPPPAAPAEEGPTPAAPAAPAPAAPAEGQEKTE